MDIVFAPGAQYTIKGFDATNALHVLAAKETVFVGGGTGSGTQGDKSTTTYSIASEFDRYVLQSNGTDLAESVIENRTPAVCSVSGSVVSWVSDGNAELVVTHPKKGSFLVRLPFSSAIGSTSAVLSGFLAGSLAAHIDASIRALLSGKTAGLTTQKWFSTWSPGTDTFVRNPDHILAGVNLSGLSVASQVQAETATHRGFSAMVTPRHFITARHYPPIVGQYLKFLGTDGNVYTRTVQSLNSGITAQGVPSTNHDLAMGMLDSPLPAAVTPFKVLPESLPSKLVGRTLPGDNGYDYNLPVIGIYTYGVNMKTVIYGTGVYRYSTRAGYTTRPPLFFDEVGIRGIGADLSAWTLTQNTTSSAPSFWMINGEPVLIGTQWVTAGNCHIAGMIPEIEAAMAAMDSTYPTMTKADLSSFTTFA